MDTKKTEGQINKSSHPPNSKASLRIGELLVKEGFLRKKDVEKAVSIQSKEKEFTRLPLGEILVKTEELSEEDLESALNHPNLRKNIGSLAVENGLIRKEDLDQCLKNKKAGQLIGEILVNTGLLTRNDIGKLLKNQVDSSKLGEVLIDLKLIKEKDLHNALIKQKSPRALGEILCELELISPQDLNYVLEKYNKQVGVEEILVKLGYIDDNKLLEAKKETGVTSEPLGTTLIKKKFLSSEQLQCALAKKYNLPFLHLNNFAYNENDKYELSNLITQKYAERNLILPISSEKKKLTIAIFRPEQMIFAGELKNLYPRIDIKIVFITEEKFEELFEILYSRKLGAGSPDEEKADASEDIDFMEIDLDESIDEGKEKGIDYGAQDIEAEELVNFIIKYGILNDASDIHIEQDRQSPKLRYRIDGIMQEINVGWLKQKLQEKVGAIISRIKVMSNLDIAEKRMPQDGVFRINYFDKANNQKFDLDFRVATCSAIVGENVTIRILDSRKANVGLDNLGHSPHVIEPFKRLLKSAAGMILVSGPTGSGKSSSLYGALRFIYNPGVKIITAEDPIEYSFPGIMQTQINPKINLTFSRLLKSFLRLDPDVILVGEMRDEETASIGFDAAQTGHLLLSTIHTNDSVSAVSRLVDLGVEYSQIASCLLAVLAQRLIRKTCPFCKKEYVPEEDEWGLLFDAYPSHLIFYKGEGCESCNFSGYKGRTLISEIFVIDKETGLALSKGLTETQLKDMAIDSGMKTMIDDGLSKMHETTLSEILRIVPHDMIKTFKSRQPAVKDANVMTDNLSVGKEDQAQVNLLPQNFLISSPETQGQAIEEMLSKYNTINASYNNSSQADISLFREFIMDSFYKIREKFNCSNVSFTIQDKKGKAEISALPENQ